MTEMIVFNLKNAKE